MIRVQNIYYMLTYAFSLIKDEKIEQLCDEEEFENTADLFAAIIEIGVNKLIKRGFNRSYSDEKDSLYNLRGKIDISESIKTQTMIKQKLVCSYDSFTVDNYFNRIIKTVMLVLIHSNIGTARKKSLRKLLLYFKDIGELNPFNINWRQRYGRNDEHYRIVLTICYFVIKGLLQSSNGGKFKMNKFFDEKYMHKLYEKFIFEYYRKEYPVLSVSAAQIPWMVDEKSDSLLPIMQSDVTIKRNDKVLIIDAKYYSHSTKTHFEKRSLISGNLYQIFTYVKNCDIDHSGNVSGMLLYAQSDDDLHIDSTYNMGGNKISVKTLELDSPFEEVKRRLDKIIADKFQVIRERASAC